VLTAADGGITEWKSDVDGGTSATVATGAPRIEPNGWPGRPGVPSVRIVGGDSFDVDLSAMESSGYTTFVVEARHGDGVLCVMGSHTNPGVGCCGNTATAFQTLSQLTQAARLGGGYTSAAYDGLFGELIVYDVFLSTADQDAVRTYLKTKWKTP
jgi:hypothetical protein